MIATFHLDKLSLSDYYYLINENNFHKMNDGINLQYNFFFFFFVFIYVQNISTYVIVIFFKGIQLQGTKNGNIRMKMFKIIKNGLMIVLPC